MWWRKTPLEKSWGAANGVWRCPSCRKRKWFQLHCSPAHDRLWGWAVNMKHFNGYLESHIKSCWSGFPFYTSQSEEEVEGECEKNSLYKSAAIWLLHIFLKKQAITRFIVRNAIEEKLSRKYYKEGPMQCCEGVRYLLTTNIKRLDHWKSRCRDQKAHPAAE